MTRPRRITVRDICNALDELAPPALAYDGDPIGLGIGHPDWTVKRILVTLTVTPGAAAQALRWDADLIVSHHAVIWHGLRNLRSDEAHTASCLALAGARIACFAAHTNLDVVAGGVNDVLADRLGLVNREPLFPAPQARLVKLVTFVPESHLAAVRAAVCEAGAGAIGNYTYCTFSASGTGTFLPGKEARPFSGTKHRLSEEPERRFETLAPKARIPQIVEALKKAHPYEEVAYDLVQLDNIDPRIGLGVRGEIQPTSTLDAFAETVRRALKLSHVRVMGKRQKRVRSVAVVGGGGGNKVGEVPSGIDVYVTGDIGYHNAVAAQERGLALIDAGHAGTEQCIVPVLARFLKQRFSALEIRAHDDSEVFHVVAG